MTFEEFLKLIEHIESPVEYSPTSDEDSMNAFILKNGRWVERDHFAVLTIRPEDAEGLGLDFEYRVWIVKINLDNGETEVGGRYISMTWYDVSVILDNAAARMGQIVWPSEYGPYDINSPYNWGIKDADAFDWKRPVSDYFTYIDLYNPNKEDSP